MKAEITKNGLLKITAETDLERYALGKWLEDNGQAVIANQLFVYGTDDPEFVG